MHADTRKMKKNMTERRDVKENQEKVLRSEKMQTHNGMDEYWYNEEDNERQNVRMERNQI